MKRDFSLPINDLAGEPIPSGRKDATGRSIPLTYGAAISGELAAPIEMKEPIPRDQSLLRFELALRIARGGEQDISIDDAKLIKEVTAAAFKPLIVGRIEEFLEGSE